MYIDDFETENKKSPYPAHIVLKLFIALILVNISKAEDVITGKWRVAKDTMEFTEDKQVHALTSFCMYNLLANNELSPAESASITMSLGVLKEIYDGYIPWEHYGIWGGDGFSKNDIAYNMIGIATAYSLNKLLDHYNIKLNFRLSI